jgi:hypothetical protein
MLLRLLLLFVVRDHYPTFSYFEIISYSLWLGPLFQVLLPKSYSHIKENVLFYFSFGEWQGGFFKLQNHYSLFSLHLG